MDNASSIRDAYYLGSNTWSSYAGSRRDFIPPQSQILFISLVSTYLISNVLPLINWCTTLLCANWPCMKCTGSGDTTLALTTLTPLYENAEREWKADPINNPTAFPEYPLTSEVVNRFYQRCDAICDNSSLKWQHTQLRSSFQHSRVKFLIIRGGVTQNQIASCVCYVCFEQ